MLRATLATCLLLCIFQINLTAQAFTYPGTIVKKNGEIVKGEIAFSNKNKIVKAITFKTADKKEVLTAMDIAAFGRDNIDYYVAAIVTYHSSSLEIYQTEKEYSQETTTDTIFLRQLVKGKFSLYLLEAKMRKCYFVTKDNGPMEELVTGVRLSGSSAIEQDQQYKNTLTNYATEAGVGEEVKSQITNIPYEYDALKNVIVKLNGNSGGSSIIKNTSLKSSSIEIGVGGIMTNYGNTKFKSDQGGLSDFLSSTDFGSSTDPRIQVSIQFAPNDRYTLLKGMFALGFSTAVFKGSSPVIATSANQQIDFYKKFSILDVTLGGMLSATPARKSSFYLSPFLVLYAITNGNTVKNTGITPNYPAFTSTPFGVGCSLGYYTQEHRIELRAEQTSGDFANDYVRIRSTKFSLTYHYKVFRF
jgi:hypothetical protein